MTGALIGPSLGAEPLLRWGLVVRAVSPSRYPMLTCNLCQQHTTSFADSHVYPLALHRLFGSDDTGPFVVNRTPDHPARTVTRSPRGSHGRFVCHECESERFGPADNSFMGLYHRLAGIGAARETIPPQPQIVEGDPSMLHRFALQTLWRWAKCPETGLTDRNYGPIVDRIRGWLQDPAGTLKSGCEVAVFYKIDMPGGLAIPPSGGWSARTIYFTVGPFTFVVASRNLRLSGVLQEFRLRDVGHVQLIVTTELHPLLTQPFAEMLADGRAEKIEQYLAARRRR